MTALEMGKLRNKRSWDAYDWDLRTAIAKFMWLDSRERVVDCVEVQQRKRFYPAYYEGES